MIAEVECALPQMPMYATNMSELSETYYYGDTIGYQCEASYPLTAGDLTRTCEQDSSWSGQAPVCGKEHLSVLLVVRMMTTKKPSKTVLPTPLHSLQ